LTELGGEALYLDLSKVVAAERLKEIKGGEFQKFVPARTRLDCQIGNEKVYYLVLETPARLFELNLERTRAARQPE
jgi:hypothetical protein